MHDLEIWFLAPAQRVEAEGTWSLFCPNEAPGLADVWGDDFSELYEKYESQGRAKRVLPARQLWFAILEAQVRADFQFYPFACSESVIGCMVQTPALSVVQICQTGLSTIPHGLNASLCLL